MIVASRFYSDTGTSKVLNVSETMQIDPDEIGQLGRAVLAKLLHCAGEAALAVTSGPGRRPRRLWRLRARHWLA